MRTSFPRGAGRTALCGVLAAGSLALLVLASAAPSGRLGLTAAAGLFPMGAVLVAGSRAGYFCWAASGLLALLLVPDKGLATLYLVFLGIYPVAKSNIEGLRRLVLELFCKALCANLALGLVWFGLRALVLPVPPEWLGERTWLFFLGGNLVFFVYDAGLTRLISGVRARLPRNF